MEIRTTYKYTYYDKEELKVGMACGFEPDNYVEIIEEYLVLYPAPGYDLKNKVTGEVTGAKMLLTGDMIDNYIEIIHEEPEPPINE